MLAARRRVLEQQVTLDLAPGANNEEDDDGYEEICFGGSDGNASKLQVQQQLQQQEHHYLTPKSILNASRKSISDTDLLAIMDENREIELYLLTTPAVDDKSAKPSKAMAGTTLLSDRTFGREPEQGFYRVYDELDRVKEWDLIPYVIARKAKLQEEEERKRQEETADTESNKEAVTVRPCASSAGSDKVSVKSEGTTSRVSVDSGRASVMSADKPHSDKSMKPLNNGNSSQEDSGSNCSADSGTYNLYDEQHQNAEFLSKVSQQLDSCLMRARSKSSASATSRRKRAPPPPPPLSNVKSTTARSSPSPPPLPPRSRTNSTAPAARRKDLSSFFGLLQDEPNQLLSKKVANSVAMRNLASVRTQSPFCRGSVVVPLKHAAVVEQERSPPGKKDLRKYLGIHDDDEEDTTTKAASKTQQQQQQQQQAGNGSLLKCLGSSPTSVLQRSLRKLSPKQLEFVVAKRNDSVVDNHGHVLDNVLLVSPPPKRLLDQNGVRRVLDFDSSHLQDSGGAKKDERVNDIERGGRSMGRCAGSDVFLVGNTPPTTASTSHVSKKKKSMTAVTKQTPPPPLQIQTNQSSQKKVEKEEAKKHLPSSSHSLPSSSSSTAAAALQQQQQKVLVEAVNKSIQTSPPPPPPPPPPPIQRPPSPEKSNKNVPSLQHHQTPTNRPGGSSSSAASTRMQLLLRSPAGHLLKVGNSSASNRRRSSTKTASPSSVRVGRRMKSPSSATPIRRPKNGIRIRSTSRDGGGRRSLMATLLTSAAKKDARGSVDVAFNGEKDEEVIVGGSRDYSRNVRVAQRQGLPVIPFLSGSPGKSPQDGNNNCDAFTAVAESCNSAAAKNALQTRNCALKGPSMVHHQEGVPSFGKTKMPLGVDCGGASSEIEVNCGDCATSNAAEGQQAKSIRQTSNPYLPMTSSKAPPALMASSSRAPPPLHLPFDESLPRSVQALATPSGLCRTSNYAPHKMLSFGINAQPLSVWRQDQDGKRQHCESCTCGGGRKDEATKRDGELDYVRMDKKRGGCQAQGEAAAAAMHF